MNNRMTVEDRLDLVDAVSRYARIADSNDVDAYVDVFTSDGVLELFVPNKAEAFIKVEGREALRKGMLALLARRTKPIKIALGYPLVEPVSAYEAITRTPFLGYHPRTTTEPPVPQLSGWYVDRWRREDGRWRLARRREQPESDDRPE
jgi:hypothetical protein